MAGYLTLITPPGDKKPQNLGPIIFGSFFGGANLWQENLSYALGVKLLPFSKTPKNCTNENFFDAVK